MEFLDNGSILPLVVYNTSAPIYHINITNHIVGIINKISFNKAGGYDSKYVLLRLR